jgi:two-component sensor histidine kinase
MGEGSEGDEGQRLLEIIDEQKARITELEAKLSDKETEMREMHHRVNNNFQLAVSTLNLSARAAESDETTWALKEAKDMIYAMASLHKELLKSGVETNMALRVMDIFDIYEGVNKDVEMILDIPADMTLPAKVAVPCVQIINELVSNCFEHAFPDGRKGEITVTMKFDESSPLAVVRDTRAVEFSVRNNGVELPDDFTFRDSKSLGMLIVKSLVSQIDGEYGFDTNNGTRFKIGLIKAHKI